MKIFFPLILTLAIISGQLIKIPLLSQGEISTLDAVVIILTFIGLIKLKFKIKKPPLFLTGALFFILVTVLSLLLTPLKLLPSEYLISFLYTLRLSAYILLAWVINQGAFPFLNKKIPLVLLLSGFFIAVLGLLQFIFLPDLRFLSSSGWDPHYFRTVSTFLDPNFTGAFLVLTLLLLSYSYLRGKNILTPRVSYIFFFIVYLALLTTFSRSSYGMFLISFTALSFFIKSWRLFLLTLILSLVLLIGFYTYTKLVSEPRNINRVQSASFRINTWQQGLTIFKSHPVLGVGFNAYRFALEDYNLGDKQFLNSHGSSSNDSSLLFVASTTGIIGLLIYLFFLFSLTRQNHIVSSAIIGLLAHSFFANSLFFPPIFLWLLVISIPKK